MRLLIHYVGDIHQPLHGVSRVDSEYPKGDRGGNSFHVQTKNGAKNLHAVWDSVVYSEHTDMKTVSTNFKAKIHFFKKMSEKTFFKFPMMIQTYDK